VPVQMAVTSFGNQKGLIVCMDDAGGLSINYMGRFCSFVVVVVFCVIHCMFCVACVMYLRSCFTTFLQIFKTYV